MAGSACLTLGDKVLAITWRRDRLFRYLFATIGQDVRLVRGTAHGEIEYKEQLDTDESVRTISIVRHHRLIHVINSTHCFSSSFY